MIAGACHCGAVRIRIDAAALEGAWDCRCSICRRYGALWTYFKPQQVVVSGSTDAYMWGRKMLAFHRCGTCGCVTHWQDVVHTGIKMGVNARMLAPAALDGIAMHVTQGPG